MNDQANIPNYTPVPTLSMGTPLPTFHPNFYPNTYSAVPFSHTQMPVQSTSSVGQYAASAQNLPSNSPITPKPTPTVLKSSPPTPKSTGPQTNISAVVRGTESPPVLLKCVRATVFNPDNPSLVCNGIIVLDDASTNSYILTKSAKSIDLSMKPTIMNLGVLILPMVNQQIPM